MLVGPRRQGSTPDGLFLIPRSMHILYVDESGRLGDVAQPSYFILAGVSVFERQTYWLAKELDDIAARFNPAEPQEVELHGSPMATRKGRWRRHSLEDREQAIKDAMQVLAQPRANNRLFVVVAEPGEVDGSPMKYAFTQLASRFDRYLMRRHKNQQRGIMLFDKSVHEETIQSLAALYRDKGHQWGKLHKFAEVPAFIDSRASRLIQLADLAAYAVNLRMRGDDRFYKIIEPKIDRDRHTGELYGLHLRTSLPNNEFPPVTDNPTRR